MADDIIHAGNAVSRPQNKSRNKYPEYQTWRAMRRRCYDQKYQAYPYYGGRGIRICSQWLNDFEQFLKDVGPKPDPTWTIERIDVNGNYEPGNVCWADKTQQAKNTRRAEMIVLDDALMHVAEACKLKGVSYLSVQSAASEENLTKAEVFYQYMNGQRKTRVKRVAPEAPKDTSPFKGIGWDKTRNLYTAALGINGKKHNLGRFETLDLAIEARRAAEGKYLGKALKANQPAKDAA